MRDVRCLLQDPSDLVAIYLPDTTRLQAAKRLLKNLSPRPLLNAFRLLEVVEWAVWRRSAGEIRLPPSKAAQKKRNCCRDGLYHMA
jgi:hypothetical protein